MKNTTITTLSTNIQICNTNKTQTNSLLTQITLFVDTIVSDTDSIIDLDIEGDINKKVNNFELLLAFFAIKSEVIN